MKIVALHTSSNIICGTKQLNEQCKKKNRLIIVDWYIQSVVAVQKPMSPMNWYSETVALNDFRAGLFAPGDVGSSLYITNTCPQPADINAEILTPAVWEGEGQLTFLYMLESISALIKKCLQ